MKKQLILCGLALGAVLSVCADDQVPAFPGAEGHGRYITGGRGGEIRHVTNLNDSGTGSLRAAVTGDAKKIVVFDVSGYIDLKSDLKIGANTTIAGQTAPGDGITLRYRTVRPDANNVIIRFIRIRRSQVQNVDDGADAIWTRQQTGMILDHCSFSWSIDEIASFYDNNNFTMQWCSLGEAQCEAGHDKGAHSYGGIWGGKEASFHHNFIAHVQNRAPRFNGARYNWTGYDKTKFPNTVEAERVDFRNCVIYNWGNGNGCYGGPGGGYINMVNNYYKAGPGTKNKTRVTQASVSTSSSENNNYSSRYFINGNYVTAASNPENYDWAGVIYDKVYENTGNSLTFLTKDVPYMRIPNSQDMLFTDTENHITNGSYTYVPMKLDSPIDAGTVTTHNATDAYAKVLTYAGASLKRDAVDDRYMEEARTGTTTYSRTVSPDTENKIHGYAGIVDVINDPAAEENPLLPSFPALVSETRPAGYDTDGDGIPDDWERANNLDPNDASDGKLYTIDPKGWYTNVEVYINSIVEHIMKGGNEDAIDTVDEYYPAFNPASGIENIESDTVKGQVERVEYYNLQGVRIDEPAVGISIRRTVYTNGTSETDKVYKK